MTVDKDKLRQAANKAESYGQTRSEHARQARAAFTAAANPATVLALLDELAAMTKARDEARADVIGFYLKQIGALSNARDEACDLVDALLVGKVGSQPNAMREQARALRKVGTHD